MVFVYELFELWNVWDGGKEEHAGSNFYGVTAEDGIDGVFIVKYGSGCFYESFSKNGMSNVGISFFSAVDSVELWEFGMA